MSSLRDVVILVDDANVDGGSAQVALASAAALAERGFSVTVCSAIAATERTRARLPRTIAFRATGQSAVLHDPKILTAAARGIWNAAAYRLVREVLAPLDVASTVVHVHGWTKALSSSVLRAALELGFPVTISLHEYFTVCPIGSLFDHRLGTICHRDPMSLECVRASCDSRSYAHKAYRVVRQAVGRIAAGIPTNVENFIAVSPFSRAILEPQLPPGARIFDIENPVDPPLREAVDVRRNDAFVFVGRLSHEKGPLLFARAMRELGHHAIFAGAGELADEVRAILPDAEITGWLDRAGLAAILRRARALVVPSLWYETFGLVVLEAAGAGIPAIVPDRCAARDLVRDGETGLVFATGDIASLQAAIAAAADDATVERLGANAYEAYWARPYALDMHVTKLVAAYEAMLVR